MSDDYLWDRSGPPDLEIERLERTLAPLRYRHAGGFVSQARPLGAWLALAAAALVAAVALWQIRVPPPVVTAWQIAAVEGSASVGRRAAALSMPVRAGAVLRTGARSGLTLESGSLGRVDLGPDSELRASGDRRVALDRGLLHAFIWAPPREFVLDTPGARAIDLGCEYTMRVAPSGDGLLSVSMGWVAFQSAGGESFIPAGAACVTRRRGGPGIPFFEDAPEPFRGSLAAWERGEPDALPRLLAAARPRDALTLWHLLTRVPAAARAEVFERFRSLVPLPPEVTREAALRRDPHAIDLCWNALDLQNTEWWRGWERRW